MDLRRYVATRSDGTNMLMISSNAWLDHDEIEARLHAVLGRFIVAFARLELNLSLRVGGEGTFVDKLERLLNAPRDDAENEDSFCKILAWYMAADSMRVLRNRLAHGRWGIHVYLQQVVHVSGYPPGPQHERSFSLSELDLIVRDAESLNKELIRLQTDKDA